MKVFKLVEENSKAITDFLATVNVTQEGFLISDGNLGIMYRERDDWGMEKNQKLIHISSEYAKSQKQWLIQEGLVRAHGEMVALWTGKMEAKHALIDEKKEGLKAYELTFRTDLDEKYTAAKNLSTSLEQKHKQAPKKDKEPILKELYEANNMLKAIEPEYLEYRKGFDDGRTKLEAEITTLTIEAANFTGKIKESTELQAQAVEDREHAEVFMKTTEKFMAELQAE